MGFQIALVASKRAKNRVRVYDVNAAAIEKGKEIALCLLKEQVSTGGISAKEKGGIWDRISCHENLEEALGHIWDSQRPAAIAEDKGKATWGQRTELPPPSAEEAEVRLFAEPLIRGAIQHRDELDAKIKQYAKNWELQRMAVVDRNVMRLAIYEMLQKKPRD